MDLFSNRNRSSLESQRASFSQDRLGNNMLARLMKSSRPSSHQLDEIIDVDRDIEIFKQNKLKLLNPQVLYNTGLFSSTTHLYRHYREEQLSVSENDSESINLISKESIQEIQKRRMNLMHIWDW